MNKKLVIAFIGLIVSNFSFSQLVTRPYVDSLLSISDTNYRHKADVLFVINGVPYDTNQVDSVISKYEQKHLADAMFISREKQSYPFYRDVAVVVFASQQKSRSKRRHWKEAKKLFSDPKETNLQLLIDKITITPEAASKTFRSIELEDIMFIDIKQNEAGKVVRIWRNE